MATVFGSVYGIGMFDESIKMSNAFKNTARKNVDVHQMGPFGPNTAKGIVNIMSCLPRAWSAFALGQVVP